jgi:hypothetical protein
MYMDRWGGHMNLHCMFNKQDSFNVGASPQSRESVTTDGIRDDMRRPAALPSVPCCFGADGYLFDPRTEFESNLRRYQEGLCSRVDMDQTWFPELRKAHAA